MNQFSVSAIKYTRLKLILIGCSDAFVVCMLLYLRGKVFSRFGLDVQLALIGVGFHWGLWKDVRELSLLLVVIEALDLTQELRGHLVERGHLVRSDWDLDVGEVADDRLEFGVVHAEKWLHYF